MPQEPWVASLGDERARTRRGRVERLSHNVRPCWSAYDMPKETRVTAQQCNRYSASGNACINTTEHADHWCRATGCDGFRYQHRSDLPSSQPSKYRSLPRGEAGSVAGGPVLDLTAEGLSQVTVKENALAAFVAKHGGTTEDALVEMRAMLAEFARTAACKPRGDGTAVRLDDMGYTLVVALDRNEITFYDTSALEISWSQARKGVKCRFPSTQRHIRTRRPSHRKPPAAGPHVDKDGVRETLDPGSTYCTSTAFARFADLWDMTDASIHDLEPALRKHLRWLKEHGFVRELSVTYQLVDEQEHVAWVFSKDMRRLTTILPVEVVNRRVTLTDQPPMGPVLAPEQFLAAISPDTIHLSARSREKHAKWEGLKGAASEDLDAHLRAVLRCDLHDASVLAGSHDLYAIEAATRTWLIRSDAQVVVGYKRIRATEGGSHAPDPSPQPLAD
jgi:hypothetical protein